MVDAVKQKCPAIEPRQCLGGAYVVYVLRRTAAVRGAPTRTHCDNGSEFCSRLVDLWAYANRVTMQFSRPDKPTDNALMESLNGSFQAECLNAS